MKKILTITALVIGLFVSINIANTTSANTVAQESVLAPVYPFLVAASNAPQVVKNAAMYLADGVDDQVEIQAAIDSLPPQGGKVMLSSGKFYINGTIHMKPKTVLSGQGHGTIVKVADGANLVRAIVVSKAPSVTIQGITLDGNKLNQTSGKGHGIEVNGSSPRTVVKDNYINDTYGRGITVYATGSDVYITNNTVNNAGDIGIVTGQVNTRILGNTVLNSGSHGILVRETTNTLISDNIVRDNLGMGIELNHTTDTIVSGNVLHRNSIIGIHILHSRSIIVADNRSKSNKNNGIDCNGSNNVSITGNISSNNGSAALEGNGILVYRCKQVTVTSNVVFNNGQGQALNRDGIRVVDDGTLIAHDVTVIGNRAYDNQSTPTQAYGIKVGGSMPTIAVNYVTITGNNVRGNGLGGMDLSGLVASPTTIINNNMGYATEAKGTVKLPNGSTEIVVWHKLDYTPKAGDIMITPITPWGSMTQFYINTYTATTFIIRVDQDPTQDVKFAWNAGS